MTCHSRDAAQWADCSQYDLSAGINRPNVSEANDGIALQTELTAINVDDAGGLEPEERLQRVCKLAKVLQVAYEYEAHAADQFDQKLQASEEVRATALHVTCSNQVLHAILTLR